MSGIQRGSSLGFWEDAELGLWLYPLVKTWQGLNICLSASKCLGAKAKVGSKRLAELQEERKSERRQKAAVR